jgi:hypothetical protein
LRCFGLCDDTGTRVAVAYQNEVRARCLCGHVLLLRPKISGNWFCYFCCWGVCSVGVTQMVFGLLSTLWARAYGAYQYCMLGYTILLLDWLLDAVRFEYFIL